MTYERVLAGGPGWEVSGLWEVGRPEQSSGTFQILVLRSGTGCETSCAFPTFPPSWTWAMHVGSCPDEARPVLALLVLLFSVSVEFLELNPTSEVTEVRQELPELQAGSRITSWRVFFWMLNFFIRDARESSPA